MLRDRPAFLGIDLGTSGVRGVVIDEDARVLAMARAVLPPSVRTENGAATQAAADWWEAVVQVLRELHAARGNGDIVAVAVDGTSATLLLTAACGVPLSRALMYDDTQGREFLTVIERWAPAGSAVNSASSSLAKLLKLRSDTPPSPGDRALHQADWVTGRLMGSFGASDPHNCLKLGYDATQERWPEWLEIFEFPPGLLPEVFPVGTALAPVPPEIAEPSGLSGTCRVVTGTTDSTAAAIASGIRQPGEAVTSLGSTLVMKVLSPVPVFDARLGIYSHRLGGLWLVGGASNAGCVVLDQHFSRASLAQLSAAMDPDTASGLDYYPLARPGERFPVSDPDLKPRLEPRPADDGQFLKGMLEGMARVERCGYETLRQLGAPYPKFVITMGGGAVNETWRKIRERILGIPVKRANLAHAAYGAALLARDAVRRGGSV